MLSQADSTGDMDMLTALKEYIRVKYHKPGNVYLGLVHRLDRPVGGLMVFARTSKAASRLSAQLASHEAGREYLCVVLGEAEERFTLTDYLVKDEIRNRVVVCEADVKGGKEAILHGRCIASRSGTSLCAIRLETGRSHQIRVQMSNAGWPLWGDNRYGKGIPGQQIALWGYKLTLDHPTTHEKLTFHTMPEGGVWALYADLLTVPEDTEEPASPRSLILSDEAARTIGRYERPPVERKAEDPPKPIPPEQKKRPGLRGQRKRTREEMMEEMKQMPGRAAAADELPDDVPEGAPEDGKKQEET